MTQFTEEQIKLLEAPLDRKNVLSRKQGNTNVSYIEGWRVIDEANRIFGFDAWDRETVILQETNRELITLKGNQGDYQQWRVGYLAKVKITVGRTIREGTGFGSGMGKPEALGDAIESAIKEAETDAMKRALMTFGNPFGLALYDKKQENVSDSSDNGRTTDQRSDAGKRETQNRTDTKPQTKAAKADARPLYTALETDMRRNRTTQELAAWWRDSECREKRSALPDDWRGNLHDAFVDYGFDLKNKERKEAADDGFPGSMTDGEALQHSMAGG